MRSCSTRKRRDSTLPTGTACWRLARLRSCTKASRARLFHTLINPERDVPQDAVRVHGHSAASLIDKPVFASIVDDFLAFIGDSKLVIHNAEFDMRFVNAELTRLGLATLSMDRVVDTLALARKKHPGAPASLDALCDRYRIDRSRRVRHGALTGRGDPGRGLLRVIRRSSAVASIGRRAGGSRRASRRGCSPLKSAASEDTSDRGRRRERTRSLY